MGLRVLTLAALLAGCAEVDVLNHVADDDARDAVVALHRAGVAARYEAEDGSRRGGYTVRVDGAQVARAVEALSREGLPRRREPGFAEAWGERSLVMTSTEERARSAQATAGELARTLETVDGVVSARVHLTLPREVELGEGLAPRPSAGVLLRFEGEPAVDAAQVRVLVAGAVEGMRADDVSVVMSRRASRRADPSPSWARVAGVVVAAESAGRLRLYLGLLAICLVAMSVAAWRWRGLRGAIVER